MLSPPRHLRLVRDASSGIEAVAAAFAGPAYDLHRHEEWLVGVTLRGVQAFHCRGARRRSTAGQVMLMAPGEPHDGEGPEQGGFAYTMLYLPQRWLVALLPDAGGFRAPVVADARLGAAICAAAAGLGVATERLATGAALDRVAAALRRHLGIAPARAEPSGDAAAARRARDLLHADLTAGFDSDALAAAAGAADRFSLARAFRAVHGVAPHGYLRQIRLVEARRALAAGAPPAAVAAACGFADQSHLGRRFRRAFGVTPAAYRALCTGVPDGRDPAGPG